MAERPDERFCDTNGDQGGEAGMDRIEERLGRECIGDPDKEREFEQMRKNRNVKRRSEDCF